MASRSKSPAGIRAVIRRLFPWSEEVSRRNLGRDAMAALLGAVLVLPQGIAFATLAGLPPQYGIYTAVVPTIVAALFGSSLHVVSGPTNALSLALVAALAPMAAIGGADYIALALAVTVIVGAIEFFVGTLRLGRMTDFISPSVLLGFTAGAAVLIAYYALGDLTRTPVPSSLNGVAETIAQADSLALLVGTATVLVIVVVRRLFPRLPFMLIGLGVGTALSAVLVNMNGPAAMDVIGVVPQALPPLSLPLISLARLPELLAVAAAISVVALAQSVAIARAVAARSGQRIDINREFVGQGLANIAGGFFSSYVACGSLNRSLPNYEAGARTPIAAIASAPILVAMCALVGPLIAHIPMAAIAGVLLYTAWSLFDGRALVRLARLNRAEFAVAAVTFVGMLTLPFHLAMTIGVCLSLMVYLYRTSHPAVRTMVPDPSTPERRFEPIDPAAPARPECPQLKLLRMEGSVYFAAAHNVADHLHAIRRAAPLQKHMLVMAKSMNFIDLAGADLWENEMRRRRAAGGDLYFHRPRPKVMDVWRGTGFLDRLGRDHVFGSKAEAIGEIFCRLDPEICRRCTARIFEECAAVPPLEGNPPEWRDYGSGI